MISLIYILLISVSVSSQNPRNLLSKPLKVSPKETGISERAKKFLENKQVESVKVWVFYTDKGVLTQNEFNDKASKVKLSDKVLNRRKKVNKDYITFADLPVESKYVKQIEKLGGILRINSKWLNASSFLIPITHLDQISRFPFVVEIKPVAAFKTSSGDPDSIITIPPKLDYGFGLDQLEQIHVPSVHERGYTGAGVTLAIFDTGYRKTHEAFELHYNENRVLAEYDFIFDDGNTSNEAGFDVSSQWNHGTSVWSVTGGYKPGSMIGPAYRANFLLAKTEDLRDEYPAEEDFWIAALEWADSLGTDVVTTSLGYSDWYEQSDFDGQTAPITLAANTAASLGIVLCNSMGNSGSEPTTLTAPADAFDILSVGAVSINGNITGFSSRGPTADGRMKPEVCALGLSNPAATTSSDDSYTNVSGTSFSAPLVAGVACLLIEAFPELPPQLIRIALMETASRADIPDNNYGWGIANAEAALDWPANFEADVQIGEAPITVNFSGMNSSLMTINSWHWDFGDGTTSNEQNPTHHYSTAAAYNVTQTVNTEYGQLVNQKEAFILATGDTLIYKSPTGGPGQRVVMSVSLKNSQPLDKIVIPFKYSDHPNISFVGVERGTRTEYFELLTPLLWDNWGKRYVYLLRADYGDGSPPLPADTGEILRIIFDINENETGGNSYIIDTISDPGLLLSSPQIEYTPSALFLGAINTISYIRGDIDGVDGIDIADLVYLVEHQFNDGPEPPNMEAADTNGDGLYDVEDIVYLVDFMFTGGPPPPPGYR